MSTTTTNHSASTRQHGGMEDTTDPDPEVPERARGPRRFPAAYKARILAEYEGLSKADKGGLCAVSTCTPRSSTSGVSRLTTEPTRRWADRPAARQATPVTKRSSA